MATAAGTSGQNLAEEEADEFFFEEKNWDRNEEKGEQDEIFFEEKKEIDEETFEEDEKTDEVKQTAVGPKIASTKRKPKRVNQ